MSARVSWVRCADGLAHLPMLHGPGMLVTGCQRSLPDAVPQSGVVPAGQRRCPECFAALLFPARAVAGGQPVPDHTGAVLTDLAPAGCSSCQSIRGVSGLACESPRVEAWRCGVRGGQWWTSTVNPVPPLLARLTEEMAGCSLLREVRTLAEHAPELSDGQVRARALSVLAALDQHARTWPG